MRCASWSAVKRQSLPRSIEAKKKAGEAFPGFLVQTSDGGAAFYFFAITRRIGLGSR